MSRFEDVWALWQTGFPEDSEEDARAFWETVGKDARCLFLHEGERPVSMAFLIPATLWDGERDWPIWYVYAAVTHPDVRGRGYFARLLDEAADLAAREGVAGLFLRPAEESLFGYYARCGFTACFETTPFEWQAKELYTKIDWKPITADYATLRKDWLTRMGVPFVKWTDAVADLSVQMAAESGGGALLCDRGLVLYHREDEDILVQELLCDPADRDTLCTSLARRMPCHKLCIQTPVQAGETGEKFGMYRPCGGEQPQNGRWYMGLTLE